MAGKFKIVISALDTTDAVLGKIRHNLGAVGRSVDKLKKRFPNLAAIAGGALRKVASALKTVAKSAGIAAAAGAGIFAFMVKSSMSATDNLAKTARKIGTTTEALSKMRYAADLTGVSSSTMDMALQRFTRRTAEAAKGTGEAKDALKELNINARQMLKLPMEDQMLELASAFEDVKNPADKVRLAMKLFDSEGVALVNTLGLGKDALAEMMGEAAALGIVMSQDAAEGVEEANDAFSRLGYLFKGIRDQLTGALAPALEALATTLKDKIQANIQSAGGSVEDFARILAVDIMQAIMTALSGLQRFINGVITTFNEIKLAASDFTGFFKSDDEKNAAQLNRRIKELNESMAERDKLIESATRSQKRGYENAQKQDKLEKERLEALLAKRKELGDVPLVPELTFADDINEFLSGLINKYNEVTLAKQGKGVDEETDPDEEVEKEKNRIQAVTDFKEHHQDLLKTGEEKFASFQKKNAVDKTKAVLDGLGETMKGSGRISKKMFAMEKAVAIGKAIMATYESATKAFAAAGGFPLGVPAAAMSIASGMANVAAIRAQSFDGGGYTGMGARTGGLDGKGGFPAILHPNETVIDHTKSQPREAGGQTVVVNQSFNVSAGVQGTVRAELENMMPMFAEQAQVAVLGAKLKGGSYSKQLLGR